MKSLRRWVDLISSKAKPKISSALADFILASARISFLQEFEVIRENGKNIFFQLNPPLRVGEILLRYVKCAAAHKGFILFHFLRSRKFHNDRRSLFHLNITKTAAHWAAFSFVFIPYPRFVKHAKAKKHRNNQPHLQFEKHSSRILLSTVRFAI